MGLNYGALHRYKNGEINDIRIRCECMSIVANLRNDEKGIKGNMKTVVQDIRKLSGETTR